MHVCVSVWRLLLILMCQRFSWQIRAPLVSLPVTTVVAHRRQLWLWQTTQILHKSKTALCCFAALNPWTYTSSFRSSPPAAGGGVSWDQLSPCVVTSEPPFCSFTDFELMQRWWKFSRLEGLTHKVRRFLRWCAAALSPSPWRLSGTFWCVKHSGKQAEVISLLQSS